MDKSYRKIRIFVEEFHYRENLKKLWKKTFWLIQENKNEILKKCRYYRIKWIFANKFRFYEYVKKLWK